MDRTHAGIAPARDGSRTPDRRTPDGGAARRAGTLLAVSAATAIAVGALGGGSPASAATHGVVVAGAGARPTPPPAITLLSQSPYVSPGGVFSMHVDIGSAVPAGATLTVTVFSAVTSRSALVEVFGGTPVGTAISTSPAVPVASLPVDPAGGVDLTIPLVAGGSPPAPSSAAEPGTFTADLHCRLGACGGVYPVRLELGAGTGAGAGGVAATGRPELVTSLVYTDPPADTQRLRVAWVVPVSLPPSPPSPDGRVPPPSPAAVARLAVVVEALSGHPEVPTTVVSDGATVVALEDDARPLARETYDQMVGLAQSSSHETPFGPFVPVDAAGMVGAGLSGELTTQVARGRQSLSAAGVRGPSGTWVSPTPVDQATMGQLSALGLDHVVLPPSSLSGATFRLTPTQPLTVASGHATVDVALEDPTLDGHFAGATGAGAVLAANQLIADLSLIYYEEPNLTAPRAVVALSPTQWSPDPAFLDTVLSALDGNPVLEPVTSDSLFAGVPTGGPAQLHHSVPDAAAAIPSRSIRSVRSQVDAFDTAVSDPGPARHIGDLLLASESSLLRPAGQASGVAGTSAALAAQLGQVSIASDTIRLTSSTAHVPITITKTAPYAVTSVMTLSSDKLLFPSGNVRTVALDKATNAVYVDMRARAGGVFRVTVTLWSPRGGLVLASRQLTVRSMSTSAVAIGLSIGAVVVLLMWWARTVSRRRPRRGAHARGRTAAPPRDASVGAGGAGEVP